MHLRYRLAGPIDDIALRHLAHVEKHVLAHFNVLAEGQIRHKQAAAGALGPLDGVALGVGVVPQGLCRLLKAGKAQGFLQLGQLGLAVDIDQVILVPEPVDEPLFVLLTENEVGGGREWLPLPAPWKAAAVPRSGLQKNRANAPLARPVSRDRTHPPP